MIFNKIEKYVDKNKYCILSKDASPKESDETYLLTLWIFSPTRKDEIFENHINHFQDFIEKNIQKDTLHLEIRDSYPNDLGSCPCIMHNAYINLLDKKENEDSKIELDIVENIVDNLTNLDEDHPMDISDYIEAMERNGMISVQDNNKVEIFEHIEVDKDGNIKHS